MVCSPREDATLRRTLCAWRGARACCWQLRVTSVWTDLYGKLDTCISADINANYDILHNAIKQAKNKHMPCNLIKFNKYKHKKSKWITQGLLKSIRSRDKLYTRLKTLQPNTIEHNALLINLKTYNNILKRSIRTAKTLYFEITFQKSKYDIRNTWKTLNDILSRNKTKDPLPTKLRGNINVIDITNTLDIAKLWTTFSPVLVEI